MKFPDEIKVGARRYKIIFPYFFKERTGITGQADHSILELRVSDCVDGGLKRPESAILVTYVHELIHIIDRVYNGSRIADMDGGEYLVEALGEGLSQILADNDLFGQGIVKLG